MDKAKLIEILLDEQVDDATRDDCAIYLSEFIDDKVVSALISVANNLKDEKMVRASCGESLAENWIRKNQINYDVLNSLEEPARTEALGILRHNKPEWYLEYEERY
ncbi:hypothetical protein [Neobacillus soli]|uniref:hypothetical protein n=1 Tax=Neobacillus soli TaxID=220688 RepID=UPI000826ACDA|nr:hypothetical protein [Neobacillus soli]